MKDGDLAPDFELKPQTVETIMMMVEQKKLSKAWEPQNAQDLQRILDNYHFLNKLKKDNNNV